MLDNKTTTNSVKVTNQSNIADKNSTKYNAIDQNIKSSNISLGSNATNITQSQNTTMSSIIKPVNSTDSAKSLLQNSTSLTNSTNI